MAEITALVVDDEPLARRRLKSLVEQAEGVRWIGEAATGLQALERIRTLEPRLVFLDVEMPGMSGIQVAERIEHPLQVIFTTAYDHYAVSAFELHAADYLLKPIGAGRLQAAIERVRALCGRPDGAPLDRIFVRERGRILPLSTRHIVRLEADGDYVRLHAGGRHHLVSGTLRNLHERLDPRRLLRVHRSHVVNLDFVESFEPELGGRLCVRLTDGSRVGASRTRSRELRRRFLLGKPTP